MKFATIAAVLSITFSTAAHSLEAYVTKKAQVVVTGLQPKQKIDVKYKNQKGRLGQRQIVANRCGEALISKAGKYQSISIEGQEITPNSLKTQEHPRCKPGKKPTLRLVK
jgi:hypothetical protein